MTTREQAQTAIDRLGYDLRHGKLGNPASDRDGLRYLTTIQRFIDGLDAALLESFRAGIKQEQDQHDFDYHGGKTDPSAEEVHS